MRKKHVTLSLLWEEYREVNNGGYEYSWFCAAYGAWLGVRDLVMRQTHKLGEKCFVDYAGSTFPIIDPETGEVHEASIFIGVLGASKYTYAEASWSQDLPSWISSHVRMLKYFKGSPEILVPDNLKSGVTKPDYYEPDINLTYQDMAEYYDIAVIPARVRKPKDKAHAEGAVLLAGRWILAVLRNRRFFSLSSLNDAIYEQLEKLNNRPFQKLPGCRRSIFEEEERPVLRPLPSEPYTIRICKKARVRRDYHIEVEGHYYSVPYTLAGEQIVVRMSSTMLEILHLGRRIASHRRDCHGVGTTTLKEHMPPQHRNFAEWTPERIESWAAKVGPSVKSMVAGIMSSRAHPEQGFRSCFGLLRMSRQYGAERLEKACSRAVRVKAFSYKSVKSILENGLDNESPLDGSSLPQRTAGYHENVRGASYYERNKNYDESTDGGKALRSSLEGNGTGLPGADDPRESLRARL
jgi:transposase